MKELKTRSKKVGVNPELTSHFMRGEEHTLKWILINPKKWYEINDAKERDNDENVDDVLLEEHEDHTDHESASESKQSAVATTTAKEGDNDENVDELLLKEKEDHTHHKYVATTTTTQFDCKLIRLIASEKSAEQIDVNVRVKGMLDVIKKEVELTLCLDDKLKLSLGGSEFREYKCTNLQVTDGYETIFPLERSKRVVQNADNVDSASNVISRQRKEKNKTKKEKRTKRSRTSDGSGSSRGKKKGKN